MLNSTNQLPHDSRFLGRIEEIADAYDRAPVFEYRALSAWRELADDSVRRAAAIGRLLDVIETDDPEPYADAPEMCADIATNRRFVVSRANSDHPVWSLAVNVALRTVHDVLGHFTSGGDFGWVGENLACGEHFPMLTLNARRALYTECIAQTGFAIARGGFGEQKVCLLSHDSEVI